MPVVYAERAKTNTRYKVLKYDPDTKRGTLKGQFAEFETNMDKDILMKQGYEIKVYADEDDPGIPALDTSIPAPPPEMAKKAKKTPAVADQEPTSAWGADDE